MATKSIDIVLSARDRASGRIQRSAGIIGRSLGGIGRAGRGAMGFLGAGLGLGFGFHLSMGIRRFARSSVQAGVDFEKAMSRIKAVTPDAAGRMEELGDLAQEQGLLWGRSSVDAADGMFELSKAGLRVEQIMGTIPHTMALAAAGELDVATAASLSVAAMKNLGMEVHEMGRVSDVLVKGANDSLTSVHDLGESFKFVGALGANLGKDLEDVVAPLMVLSDVGLSPQMAGTGLRQVFTDLAGGNALVSRFIKSLGVDTDALKVMGLADQVDLLAGAMSHLSKEDRASEVMRTFGERSGSAMLALMNQGGDAIRRAEAAVRAASGTTQQVATEMLNNVGGSFAKLGQAWRILKEDMFGAQAGMLKDTIDWLTAIVRFMGMDGFFGVLLDDMMGNLLVLKHSILSWFDRAGLEIVHAATTLGIQISAGIASGMVQATAFHEQLTTSLGDSLVAKGIETSAALGRITPEEKEAQLKEIYDINEQRIKGIEREKQDALNAIVERKTAALDLASATREAEIDAIAARRDEEVDAIRLSQDARWAGLFAETERARNAADAAQALNLNLGDAAGNVEEASEGIGEIVKQAAGLATLSESRFLTGHAEAAREAAMGHMARDNLSEQKKHTDLLKKILLRLPTSGPGSLIGGIF